MLSDYKRVWGSGLTLHVAHVSHKGPFSFSLQMYYAFGPRPHTPTPRHLHRLLAVCPMTAIGHRSHQSNHMEKADVMTTVKPIPVLSLDKLPESCRCRSRKIPALVSSDGRVHFIRQGEGGGA